MSTSTSSSEDSSKKVGFLQAAIGGVIGGAQATIGGVIGGAQATAGGALSFMGTHLAEGALEYPKAKEAHERFLTGHERFFKMAGKVEMASTAIIVGAGVYGCFLLGSGLKRFFHWFKKDGGGNDGGSNSGRGW